MVSQHITPQYLYNYGITNCHEIIYNPSFDRLFIEETDPDRKSVV